MRVASGNPRAEGDDRLRKVTPQNEAWVPKNEKLYKMVPVGKVTRREVAIMGRSSRREALVALGRVAASLPADRQDDLAVISAQLRTNVAEALRAAAGYTTTEARERLKVTLPTVHAWIEGGLLPTLEPSSRAILIDRRAVDELAEALEEIRSAGPKKHLLRDVAAWLESQRLSGENPDLAPRARARTSKRIPWREAVADAWGPEKRTAG